MRRLCAAPLIGFLALSVRHYDRSSHNWIQRRFGDHRSARIGIPLPVEVQRGLHSPRTLLRTRRSVAISAAIVVQDTQTNVLNRHQLIEVVRLTLSER